MTAERDQPSLARRGLADADSTRRGGEHAGHHDDKRNREPDQIGDE
jgi:hypothetical protein